MSVLPWMVRVYPCIAYKGHAEEEVRNAYKNRDSDNSSEGKSVPEKPADGKEESGWKEKPGETRTSEDC